MQKPQKLINLAAVLNQNQAFLHTNILYMQALILAAGMGRRLGEFTADNTKCMLPVNGIRLIDRVLGQLDKLSLRRIILVVGYEAENLRQHVQEHHSDLNIVFVENPIYDKTNNIYSLWLARDLMAEDETLLIESDLIFEDRVLQMAVESEYPNVALVAKYETWMDGTMVRIDDDCKIVSFIPKKAFKYTDTEFYYKTVNVYKFSPEFVREHYLPFLEAYIKVLGQNEYYEQVLRVITMIDVADMRALPISGLRWYEIDDVQDLRIAETIFAEPKSRLEKLKDSDGGYWRYADVIDFCHPINPYFPQSRLIDEMKANFDTLVRSYPSGIGVNSLLAAKYFGVSYDLVAVGNGIYELIKSFMELADGFVGMVCPTLEKYSDCISDERIVKFYPGNEDFKYSANDLIEYFTANPVDTLMIVNPDNPSGNLIDRDGLERLTRWSEECSIRLIVDESFIDFADCGQQISLLHNDILREFPHLCVIKSISKSYGVPGLRIGVLASADIELIRSLRKNVCRWNINSIAEFYMQIFNKYEKDYIRSCELFRHEREIFFEELSSIPFMRVIPSQAAYFLCELRGIKATELALRLMTDYNILIKSCSDHTGFPKSGEYVRIAIRNRRDNSRLVDILKSLS